QARRCRRRDAEPGDWTLISLLFLLLVCRLPRPLPRLAGAADRALRLHSEQPGGRPVAEGPLHAHRPFDPLRLKRTRQPGHLAVGQTELPTPLGAARRGGGAAWPLLFRRSVGRL